ncbi:MAG TPA: cytochrome c biogenesis protein CcsA [Thermoguttaceae bacterium]|nr:cytochrome c biogenesis protein CcsA [Thermoguttaceae bacterium]
MQTDAVQTTGEKTARGEILLHVLVGALVTAAVLAICLFAPTEKTMGDAQRIVYIHVSVAWLGLLGFIVMAVCGVLYLLRRNLAWDQWSQAAAELGWLCCGLTLVTGSLWARAAWDTWWTWDPRLTTSFILWMLYCGYLLMRAGIDDAHQRARVGAVLAIVGMLDVPLVAVAARWFRGMHPAAPTMDPTMRAVLLSSVVGFTALFAVLLVRRRAQLRLEHMLDALQRRIDLNQLEL